MDDGLQGAVVIRATEKVAECNAVDRTGSEKKKLPIRQFVADWKSGSGRHLSVKGKASSKGVSRGLSRDSGLGNH